MNLTGFSSYVGELEDLAVRGLRGRMQPDDETKVQAALNGGPSRALRRSVRLKERQDAGVFFTGPQLGDQVLDRRALPLNAVYLDPACGSGDLLLRSASCLPVEESIDSTFESWGERLIGLDLHPEFVRAARARLVLYALSQIPGSLSTARDLDGLFPKLRCADALSDVADLRASTHVLLNPPYTRTPAPDGCSWANGTTSSAALFSERYISCALPGTRIWAILPDVLRTGSLYKRWRTRLQSIAEIDAVAVWGAFDANADVDVFILRTIANPSPVREFTTGWWTEGAPPVNRLGERFAVSVGPVVPHRHPTNIGVERPFLHAKNAPAWGELTCIAERRHFAGRTVDPPFVAVRRTSSPSDPHRAVATVIGGSEPVAVENHLIVLQPHDGSLETCRSALSALKNPTTDEWLNERIRCRHLTVESLRDLPWVV